MSKLNIKISKSTINKSSKYTSKLIPPPASDLPPLSSPKFVERFRQTKDQNFITHFYECFKQLHFPDRIVHNNAIDMLKIIIQQRKEFLDKLSPTTEALGEMEEKLKKLKEEIEVKDLKLVEEQSKNGTIMFHLNGLNRKHDDLEKVKAELTEKLSTSEKAVQKWADSAMADHEEVGKYKSQIEELQKQLEAEKKTSKANIEKANLTEKDIKKLMEQNRRLNQQIENFEKEQQNRATEESLKNAKRSRRSAPTGSNFPSTSVAAVSQQNLQCMTSPSTLPSFTPPEKTLNPQNPVPEVQNFIVFQQTHFQTPINSPNGSKTVMPSNNQQQQQQQQKQPPQQQQQQINPILVPKRVYPTLKSNDSTVAQQQKQIHANLTQNGLSTENDKNIDNQLRQQQQINRNNALQKQLNQSNNSTVLPQQQLQQQQQQKQQQQQQKQILSRRSSNGILNTSISDGNNNNSQQSPSTTASTYSLLPQENVDHQKLHQHLHQIQFDLHRQNSLQSPQNQIIHPQQIQLNIPNNNNLQQIHSNPQSRPSSQQNHQQIPQQQQQQFAQQLSSPTNIFIVPQNMLIQSQPHSHASSSSSMQFNSPQQQQQQSQIPHNPQQQQQNPPPYSSHHLIMPAGLQNMQFQTPLSSDVVLQCNKYFYSLTPEQRNQLLYSANITGINNLGVENSN